MATKEKMTRKELRDPDAVQESLGRVGDYIQNNTPVVLGGIGAVLVAVAVLAGGTSYLNASKDATAAAFARAVANLEYDSPSAAIVGLSGVAEGSSGSYPEIAVLYRGRVYAQTGEYEKALTDFQAARKAAPTDYLRQAATVGAGNASAELGRQDEALSLYAEAAALDGPYKIEALEARVRIATAGSKDELAVESLRSLLELELAPAKRESVAKKLAKFENEES
jgi:tetratricopeptide (TPR) repeat protein